MPKYHINTPGITFKVEGGKQPIFSQETFEILLPMCRQLLEKDEDEQAISLMTYINLSSITERFLKRLCVTQFCSDGFTISGLKHLESELEGKQGLRRVAKYLVSDHQLPIKKELKLWESIELLGKVRNTLVHGSPLELEATGDEDIVSAFAIRNHLSELPRVVRRDLISEEYFESDLNPKVAFEIFFDNQVVIFFWQRVIDFIEDILNDSDIHKNVKEDKVIKSILKNLKPRPNIVS